MATVLLTKLMDIYGYMLVEFGLMLDKFRDHKDHKDIKEQQDRRAQLVLLA